MAHSYKYTILTAIPDRRRGERVNVGIVVFREGKPDVRLAQAAFKLKALTRENWETRLEGIRERLVRLCAEPEQPETLLERLAFTDPLISAAGMGTLSAHGQADYEKTVEQVMETLVLLPKLKQNDAVSRINTEIAKTFRKAKALAGPDQGIKEGKIVRFLPIAPNEGLLADFALRNGKMHIASTLDLRKQSVRLDEAALKSIVLDKSRVVYGKSVRTIGVYAVEPDLKKHFSHHIELLADYADETYNWLEQTKRGKFLRTMYDALHGHH
jgi:hypothetical protein